MDFNDKHITHFREFDPVPPPSNDCEEVVDNSLIGLEIEGERIDRATLGVAMDGIENRQLWSLLRDGSLRGANFEAVFSRPLSGTCVVKALDTMERAMSRLTTKPDYNARTSVHVHVNVRDLSMQQLRMFVALYVVFEDVIFNYVGDVRRNNNYCIPNCEDSSTISLLACLSTESRWREFSESGRMSYASGMVMPSKYSAMNFVPLHDFGTLEFRHHAGTHDKERLLEWINILLSLKKWARDSTVSINDLAMYISGDHYDTFFDEIFGYDLADKLRYPGCEVGMLKGIRTIQLSQCLVKVDHSVPIVTSSGKSCAAKVLEVKQQEKREADRKKYAKEWARLTELMSMDVPLMDLSQSREVRKLIARAADRGDLTPDMRTMHREAGRRATALLREEIEDGPHSEFDVF